ncbi:glycosyltransferase family 4 protein [Pontiellaceae bacterium B12219]|nr:glycosyltransferase family 4 protein [Pontiellaceae bacterium B12219]
MKILCFIDSLDSGGAQRQLVGLSRLLKNASYEVKIVSYWDITFWDDFLREHEIDFENITGADSRFKKMTEVYRRLSDFEPDVVIAYLNSPTIMACLFKILGHRRFKLIVSDRNTTQSLTLSEKVRFFLYRWADWIVPNSHTQTRFIKKHYPRLADKTVPITNFVDTELFKPGAQAKVRSRALRILMVGRIAPQKNVIRFLQAIAKVTVQEASFQIDWYGRPNPESYFEECLRELTRLGLEKVVYFHEPLDQIQQKYHEADVFCLPSIYEGFPNVVCEAMSSGLPILCSNICDNPDMVKDGVNGFLFDPESVEEMAEVILRFLSLNEPARAQMGAESRRLALAKFSEQTFFKEYLKLLGEES